MVSYRMFTAIQTDKDDRFKVLTDSLDINRYADTF